MNRYITTTLPYVNADPHVGFALEAVQADALARYWRLIGDEVFFSTGADEHGQKILQKAQENNEDVQEYVDRYAAEFEKLREVLNLSYDNFIRTTDSVHVEAAQEMWRRCEAQGDIYKKRYTGLYCVGCEAFVKESELVDGKCSIHTKEVPAEIEEENYFFKLSKYQDPLLKYLEGSQSIVPDWRQKEVRSFVEQGLEDISISREKRRMSWGVPVPGDEDQVMYVWFDALTNYISTLGWPQKNELFDAFWEKGETVQVAGKDQLRFQSIIWQAMLMSAGISNTDRIFYHGFINWGGQKMSKSLGNVIAPHELVERYGTEATRYLLLRHVHPTEDSDFTWEKLDEWYTANLVNGIGNVTSRIMKMAEDNLEGSIEVPEPKAFDVAYAEALEHFEFQKAADVIWKRIGDLDDRIATEEPFKVVKEDAERGKKIIRELVEELYVIARMLYPFMPETNKAIKEAVKANAKPSSLFERLEG